MEFVSIVPGVMALYSLTSDLDTALSALKLVENSIFVLTFGLAISPSEVMLSN